MAQVGLSFMLPSFDVGSPATLSQWPTAQRGGHVLKDDDMFTPRRILLSLAAVSALAITTPASADWKTKQVKHQDLDLSVPAGRQRLEMRLKQAVKQVCRSPRDLTIKERQDRLGCEKAATARAARTTEKIIAAYVENRRLAFDNSSKAATN